jgi:hypothetical protein
LPGDATNQKLTNNHADWSNFASGYSGSLDRCSLAVEEERRSDVEEETVNTGKKIFVMLTMIFLGASFLIFLVTGYAALYWAWTRANLKMALPYLPWARNFGMLAMVGAAVALGILFSSKTFPLPPKMRLLLSLFATATIGFFAEFRNEGKFYFKNLHHFFGPGTGIHDALNRVVPSLGDFLYRAEYSHWNDFLLGPAIVSVLFPLAIGRIYTAFSDQSPINPRASSLEVSTDLDQALRFARILMYVGLFWFFWQSWAEKAGYLSNPHSSDEVDLPFEFGGTMLGFWTARVLTKPFDLRPEKFRSTFFVDFLSAGVIGLLYTLIVGPLIEDVTSAVAHALYPVVPHSLDVHQYSPFQRHLRPVELLILAGATWWILNRSSKSEEMTQLNGVYEEAETDPKWNVPKTITKVFGMMIGYLAILAIVFSLLEPQGLVWTLVTAGTGLATGTAALLLVMRARRHGFTRLLSKNQIRPSGRQ